MNHDDTNPKPDPQPNMQAWIEPELEARVVAWVAGEASAFEIAELERLIAEKPELAIFKRRIEAVHGLVAEAALPDKEPLRLSDERRARVLATIGAAKVSAEPVRTKKKAVPPERSRRWWLSRAPQFYFAASGLAAAGLIVLFLQPWQVAFQKKPARPEPVAMMIAPVSGYAPVEGEPLAREMAQKASEAPAANFNSQVDRIAMPSPVEQRLGGFGGGRAAPAEDQERLRQAWASNLGRDAGHAFDPGTTMLGQATSAAVAPEINKLAAIPAGNAGIVKLDAFTVSGTREGAAAAISSMPPPATTLATTPLAMAGNAVANNAGKESSLQGTGGLVLSTMSTDQITTIGGAAPSMGFNVNVRDSNAPVGQATTTVSEMNSLARANRQDGMRGFYDTAGKNPAAAPAQPAAPQVMFGAANILTLNSPPPVAVDLGMRARDVDEAKPAALKDGSGITFGASTSAGGMVVREEAKNEVVQLQAFAVTGEKQKPESRVAKGRVVGGIDGTIDRAGATDDKAEQEKKLAAKPVQTSPSVALSEETNTAREPVSTFSLHVSDVSFRLAVAAAAAMERGENPRPPEIRAEEFYNAFDYGDPAPTVSEKISARIEQSAHPVLQQRNLLRIAMKVPAAGRGAGTPLQLTVLLDTSGSMERDDRRESVRRALEELVALLGPNDRITLIGFARQPRLLAENVQGNQAGSLVELAARTPAEGGTNIEEALRVGGELAVRHRIASAQNRIVLLTDGAANLGNAEPEQLARSIETLRQQGVAFDACGIGLEGIGDTVLEALTRKGDGRYYVIDRPEAADAAFARQLAGAFRPAAENVKLQVRFNPARVGNYRLIGFEQHRLKEEDFRNDRVDAAELAADEAANALYQIEVLPQGAGEVGEVFVRFRDPATGMMVERSWTISYDSQAPRFDRATPSLQLAGVAALLAEKFTDSPVGSPGTELEFAL